MGCICIFHSTVYKPACDQTTFNMKYHVTRRNMMDYMNSNGAEPESPSTRQSHLTQTETEAPVNHLITAGWSRPLRSQKVPEVDAVITHTHAISHVRASSDLHPLGLRLMHQQANNNAEAHIRVAKTLSQVAAPARRCMPSHQMSAQRMRTL